ncbi:unnamed protein product [Cylicocyclus nassatus]|uniref:SHSP domain-containing protein n=1 Tax=Cylicocyclus nassatus TaxID=53992 RepID=A0AA36M3J7_CYLNA|nr:unnamed protein product [Cylicocyclus nassatus]
MQRPATLDHLSNFTPKMSLWPRSPMWDMTRSPMWDDPFFREQYERFRMMERGMFPYWRNADPSVMSVANDTQQVINDDKRFAVSLDVSQFRPDELKVQLEGRQLVIEGKQENKGDNNYTERSFVRKWTLPDDVNIDAIRSELSDVGHLSIEAPKTGQKPENVRAIPIQRTLQQ